MRKLTKRQRECLALKARGLTAREIGERLVISPRTVETHLQYARDRTCKRTIELAYLVVEQE